MYPLGAGVLLAAHVRTTHAHTVVEAEVPPERVMGDFKAYAGRLLNRMGLGEPGRQGEAMAVFQSDEA